ncbi:putative phosphoenolpyruvate carboxylase [Helianthus annuus]|nr:putative phosphoenolpyruvate carboxylase [Helianthus annuus]
MQSQVESPLRFVSFLEKLTDLKVGPAAMARLFSIEWYNNELNEGVFFAWQLASPLICGIFWICEHHKLWICCDCWLRYCMTCRYERLSFLFFRCFNGYDGPRSFLL